MLIDEIGFFWWDDTEFHSGAVPGHLSIDEEGNVNLEMHGPLGGNEEYNAIFSQMPLEGKRIRGELKKSGKKILLTHLISNGGTLGRFSYVNYVSQICYVSQSEIEQNKFIGLLIPLDGLEGWFKPGTIDYINGNENPTHLNFALDLSMGETWTLDAGSLSLTTMFQGNIPNSSSYNINVSMNARFEYTHNETISGDELLQWYDEFSDLISILTNSTYIPNRPSVRWTNENILHTAECYYTQHLSAEKNINWHNVRLPLLRIKKDFGKLLQNWFNKKKSLGPGINLYLGIIKNRNLYAEHRFVNMIWGLESLDRRNEMILGTNSSDKLNQKSKRIIESLDNAKILNSNDKRWLFNILRRNHERSLAERLYDVISPVATIFLIDSSLLRKFCKECADLRNDLSHHGGERTPGELDSFIDGIIPKMYALEMIYPLIILKIIDLEERQLTWIMHQNINSGRLKMTLKKAGLLPDE